MVALVGFRVEVEALFVSLKRFTIFAGAVKNIGIVTHDHAVVVD